MSWLVRLYPPAWRQRYGTEMRALLDATDIALADVWDVVCGAFDAWLTGPWGVTISRRRWLGLVGGLATMLLLVATRKAVGPSPEVRMLAIGGVVLIAIAQAIAMRATCAPARSA